MADTLFDHPDLGIEGYPVPIMRIEAQQRIETRSVERGLQRYRAAVLRTDVADTNPGVAAMRDILSTLIPAITEAQRLGREACESRGQPPGWAALINILDADKLAYLTVRTLLTTPTVGAHIHPTVARIARLIGRGVQHEVEFEQWRSREKEVAGEDRPNMYKVLQQRAKNIDARTFRRWTRKLDTYEKLQWTDRDRLQLGAALITVCVEAGGGWIEVHRTYSRNQEALRVGLSEQALRYLSDSHARLELMRPYLLPMIVPPKPWMHEET